MSATIDTTQLTKRFGSFTAVNGIDVHVKSGEIFGFLGPNGAGKTTAIRMLCGLLVPTGGSGKVAGYDIMKETARIRNRIGYMSQRFSLYPDLSVRDNMKLYGTLYGLSRKQLTKKIHETSEFLGIGDLLRRTTGDLPWGWQQRLSLACASMHNPSILFLDEPTGSVDPLSRRNFWDLIDRLSRAGTTVFVTTHHLDEAEYCHRISVMIAGKIAAVDSPLKLKQSTGTTTLHDAFLRITQRQSKESADA
ncbi:MAG: ABC transporter ATP-binding protein [Chitinispirillaceae bacterium]